MSISHAYIFSNMACHNKYMAKHSIKTEASERLQEIVTKNIRVRLALYNVKQTTLAEALLQTQAGLSAKINRKSEWTVADIANAAAFFHEPVENLITSSTLDAISGSSEYQLEHNVPVDISRRELSAPAGARYLGKPDENEDRPHGAVGPRAFVMPLDVDQMNLGPRFSARTRFRLPHLDSNQDKGFQRPVCCHYTMGERRKHMFSAKCSLCHILRTPHTTGCRAASLRTFGESRCGMALLRTV